ncbi:hypothetical protein BDV96DRAFT_579724 [Lophiotrema nucula]|uniref:Uncharacterized protein n=1 Tax=Lophiotrema nucula TaxID=690887 RepID=A0A6A5Z3U9_9PLEO|nr:hypothetical protein BDV96DRAFT_579724 [Lophiotrema nucula]
MYKAFATHPKKNRNSPLSHLSSDKKRHCPPLVASISSTSSPHPALPQCRGHPSIHKPSPYPSARTKTSSNSSATLESH